MMTLKNSYKKDACGFLYYAHNNDIINYLRLAICSALSARHQLSSFRATIVTDDNSISSLSSYDKKILEQLFEEIKINNRYDETDNSRVTLDGDTNHGSHLWYNGSRPNALDDSPYEETIMIDVDFIFQDNNLEKLWGASSPIMMNKFIIPSINETQSQQSNFKSCEKMGAFSPMMYWATVVYFNRTSFASDFFNLVNHIKENYFYYQRLYQVMDGAYRNDYSFSMALYILNGTRVPGTEWEIPYKFVLSPQRDMIYKVHKNRMNLMISTYDRNHPKKMVNIQNISIHCMNKNSLQNRYDEFLKVYGDE